MKAVPRSHRLIEEKISESAELARKYLDDGYTCSQSVLKAMKRVLPYLESIDEMAFAGFGGGFAQTGRVCGAVVVATMVTSAAMMDPEAPFDRDQLNTTLQCFYDNMEAEYGSVDCLRIVGLDFRDPEQAARYQEEKHEQVCKPLVGRMVQMIGEVLLGPLNPDRDELQPDRSDNRSLA